jgi:hypothetical protein
MPEVSCRRAGDFAWRSLVLLAAVFTLLNCCKPLHIDDTAYYYYAEQIAHHPLDPYGFAVYWWDWPEPANQVLAPAVFPYYWSVAIRLFGPSPLLWKLWLFPVALLLTFALYALLRRFARGLELPLTWLLVLSPAFLPSFNLMLDVPALALSLAALAVFCRACDRDSLPLAAAAGLLAGLAAQTKYTGLLAPALLLLYSLCFGKWRLGLVAAVLAVQVFVSWEFLLALLYGRSHFLLALADSPGGPLWERIKAKARLLLNVVSISGGIGPAGLLLGLAALRVRRPWLILAGIGVLSVYAVVAGAGWEGDLPLSFVRAGPVNLSFESLLFGVVGLCLLAVTGVVAWRLLRRRHRRAETFLLLWLGLELLGYVTMTPFSAVRRLLGLMVAGTLLCGRLAAFTRRSPSDKKLIWGLAAVSAVLGLGFFGVDWLEARAQKDLAEEAVRWIRRQDGDGTIWYVGHWGFQFYAERAGMRPVVPGDTPREEKPGERSIPLPPPSLLRRGDWLVFPDERLTKQCLRFDHSAVQPVTVLEARDPVPLRTVVCYYAGRSALEHRPEPTRLTVTIYRITADIIPSEQPLTEGPCPAP